MTLREAVKEVIRQNEVGDYKPILFKKHTENGDAVDLNATIERYLADPENKKEIFRSLEKYKGKPIYIEEFMAMYHFNLPRITVQEAIDRTCKIQEVRFFWQKSSLN